MTVSVLLGCALIVGAACGSSVKGTPSGPGTGDTPTTAAASNGGGY